MYHHKKDVIPEHLPLNLKYNRKAIPGEKSCTLNEEKTNKGKILSIESASNLVFQQKYDPEIDRIFSLFNQALIGNSLP